MKESATISLGIFIMIITLSAGFSIFDSNDVEAKIFAMKHGQHNPYKEFNEFVNGLFFNIVGANSISDQVNSTFGSETGYYVLCYLRDLVAGTAVYWITAGIWHITIYNIFGNSLFISKGRPYPSKETIMDQMALAQSSIFVYAGLPIISEYLIENNYT
eukprot:gene68701-94146_t